MAASKNVLDCVIVGGGPAGLTAAVYLARFDRNFVLVDAGCSRARWIPASHNIPLFAHGISGLAILERQREHAAHYGAMFVDGEAMEIAKRPDSFTLGIRKRNNGDVMELEARSVLLATGVADIEPKLAGVPEAIKQGLLRYCPICDGYEARGKNIGVIAYRSRCIGEAAFIARTYSASVSLLFFGGPPALNESERGTLERYRIRLISEPIERLALDSGRIVAIGSENGTAFAFDTVYSALGVQYRSGLAAALGAAMNEDGALLTGAHCETSVEGLYAAGDVTRGLNQIVVALGQAAIAATAIHNRC